MTNGLLSQKLEWLYKNEINFTIETFWDAGVTFKLGDNENGFIDQRTFEISSFEDGVYWLCESAKKWWPSRKILQQKFSDKKVKELPPDGIL